MPAQTMPAATIAVVGSGSLARAVYQSLAVGTQSEPDFDVVVLARNPAAATAAAVVAGALAALAGRPRRFGYLRADLGDTADLTEALRAASPLGVVLCASHQSPWEGLTAPSAWTALLARAGFGLTLPLQAVPA